MFLYFIYYYDSLINIIILSVFLADANPPS